MKKNYFLIAALLAFVVILPSTLKANTKKTKQVTAYYCEGFQGSCLTFYNSRMNMNLTIPGELHVITITIPANYIQPPSGYNEYEHFFCHNPNNNSIGTGIINGYLHYKDPNSTFYAYECEVSTIYTNFNEWQNALP